MSGRAQFHVAPEYQRVLSDAGLNVQSVYSRRDIKVCRSISERENCTLDLSRADGSKLRLHIKRFHAVRGRVTPAQMEVQGVELLKKAGIPTVTIVAWGALADRRSFVITEDLAGYEPADGLLRGEMGFADMSPAIAHLAADLHRHQLHHRDLYLCHFFIKPAEMDVRLIDAARVRRLPPWPMRRRWIVKDLAQLWYSMKQAGVGADDRRALLEMYGTRRELGPVESLVRAVEAKSARIARHDARLRRKAPQRNVSIPIQPLEQRRML